jgi:hypothetical protein
MHKTYNGVERTWWSYSHYYGVVKYLTGQLVSPVTNPADISNIEKLTGKPGNSSYDRTVEIAGLSPYFAIG